MEFHALTGKKGERRMNETRFYLGAYLEVKTRMHTRITTSRECENGHKVLYTQFCAICGEAGKEVDREIQLYPYGVEEFLDEKWEDRLAHLNSPSQEENILRLISNRSMAGRWVELNEHGDFDSKEFPTAAEIEAMKAELLAECQEVFAAIAESPDVVSMTMKAGCVMDTEF